VFFTDNWLWHFTVPNFSTDDVDDAFHCPNSNCNRHFAGIFTSQAVSRCTSPGTLITYDSIENKVKCYKEARVQHSTPIHKASDAQHSERTAGMMNIFRIYCVMSISDELKLGDDNLLSDS
jgi:hypothetical protein